MVGETLFAQITHEAPSAPKREKSLLPVCCICGRFRDETALRSMMNAGSRNARTERHMA